MTRRCRAERLSDRPMPWGPGAVASDAPAPGPQGMGRYDSLSARHRRVMTAGHLPGVTTRCRFHSYLGGRELALGGVDRVRFLAERAGPGWRSGRLLHEHPADPEDDQGDHDERDDEVDEVAVADGHFGRIVGVTLRADTLLQKDHERD